MNNDTKHLSLVPPANDQRDKPDRWSPLIPPQPAPREDDDWRRVEETRVMRALPKPVPMRTQNHVIDQEFDRRQGRMLLFRALAELASIRRRYARLDALAPVFAAVEGVAEREAGSDAARRAAAVLHAREMVEREGFDLRTAAERAAGMHGAKVGDVVEGLRERVAG